MIAVRDNRSGSPVRHRRREQARTGASALPLSIRFRSSSTCSSSRGRSGSWAARNKSFAACSTGLAFRRLLTSALAFRIQKQKRKKLYRGVEILCFPFLGPFEFRLGHVGVPSSLSIFPQIALPHRPSGAASSTSPETNLTPGPRANDRGTTLGFQSPRFRWPVFRMRAEDAHRALLFPTPLSAGTAKSFLGLSLTIFVGSLIATLGDRVRTRRR